MARFRCFRIKFAGKWWTWKEVRQVFYHGKPICGVCWHSRRRIHITKRQLDERNALGTYIHEATHAICPDLTEAAVERIEFGLTELLYDKLRYRRFVED